MTAHDPQTKTSQDADPGSGWFRDAEFWRTMRPLVFSVARFDSAGAELDGVSHVLDIVGAPTLVSGVRVLDMPCGPGRHATELAARGCEVHGVDLMQEHIDSARALAVEAGVSVSFEVGDMYATSFEPASFDVALNLYTSLGYSDDADDDHRLFETYYAALRPGGALVVETLGKEILARDFEPTRYHEADGWVVHERVEVRDAWRRVSVTLTFMRDGEDRSTGFEHRVYGASDLISMMESCGFRVTVFGDMAGAAYDHRARRLVAVGIKPEKA